MKSVGPVDIPERGRVKPLERLPESAVQGPVFEGACSSDREVSCGFGAATTITDDDENIEKARKAAKIDRKAISSLVRVLSQQDLVTISFPHFQSKKLGCKERAMVVLQESMRISDLNGFHSAGSFPNKIRHLFQSFANISAKLTKPPERSIVCDWLFNKVTIIKVKSQELLNSAEMDPFINL